MKTYEPRPGEHVRTTAEVIVGTAQLFGDTVTAEFNGIVLTATPTSDASAIVAEYGAEQNRLSEAYRNSPEGQKAATEAEAFQKKADAAKAQGILQFQIKNQAWWQKHLDANADDEYGAAILRYAARWAHMMEKKIADGMQLEDIAEATRHDADMEGITGYMYGAAVSVLSKVWEHGEQLRQWHNHTTQLHGEGDKANRDGGVLNQALLRIG